MKYHSQGSKEDLLRSKLILTIRVILRTSILLGPLVFSKKLRIVVVNIDQIYYIASKPVETLKT